MSTDVKKKKKRGTADDTKLIKILAISLSALVVVSAVVAILLITTGNYVAKVKGEKIYTHEYTYYLNRAVSDEVENIEIPEDASSDEKTEIYETYFSTKGEDGKYPLDRIIENAIEEARIFKTSYLLAKDKGYSLTSEEKSNVETNLDSMINYYYQMYSQYGTSMTYDDIVSYYCGGMTLKQYKAYAVLDTTIAKYKEALKETYEVDEDALRSIYDEEPNDYRKITVQKFFLSTQKTDENDATVDMTDEEKAAVKAKIDDYLAKFKSGELVFEDTIKSDSEESSSATDKGISTINNNSLTNVEVIDNWALERQAVDAENEYTVLESDTGYYIIRCTAIEDFDNSEDSEEGAEDSIKNTIKATWLEDKASAQVREEALADTSSVLSDKKEDKMQELIDENETIKSLITTYGAKSGDDE